MSDVRAPRATGEPLMLNALTWLKSKCDELSGGVEYEEVDPGENLEFYNPLPEYLINKLKQMNSIGEYFDTNFGLLSNDKYEANGAFGMMTTHYYENTDSNQKIAFCIKRISLNNYNEINRADLINEVTIQSGIRESENNTVLHHHLWDNDFLYLIMPYAGTDISETIFHQDTHLRKVFLLHFF